jgi:hypothetical protein
MRLVLCVWEDASDVDEGPWTDRAGAKPGEPVVFHQVGYVFALTSECIEMTCSVSVDHMAPRSRIPIGMVRKLVELTEGVPVKIPRTRKARK